MSTNCYMFVFGVVGVHSAKERYMFVFGVAGVHCECRGAAY